ncbi:MAG: nicotinate-nucleotide adenylyltransferase [Spartobacteria bacterium]|nr:nicotinate-nucleotide adenylyltransferase [Spartobacteria bacterium]
MNRHAEWDELPSSRAVGVMGGTFNPVHNGHLIMAQDAMEQFELDQVLFVPCAEPYHKRAYVAEYHHRFIMTELATEQDYSFDVSDIELEHSGPSYSLHTMQDLKKKMPGATFYFIIGADSLYELYTWYHIETLMTLCRFIVIGRPGFDVDQITAENTHLPEDAVEQLRKSVAKGHEIGISSTEIRARIAEGLRISYLVPPEVEMYIAEHGLYTD